MNNQLEEMRGSGVQMDRLIKLYRIQNGQMTRLANETKELAIQAKNQAEQTTKIAKQTNRLAIASEITANDQALILRENEQGNCSIYPDIAEYFLRLFINNNGTKPCFDVHYHAKITKYFAPFRSSQGEPETFDRRIGLIQPRPISVGVTSEIKDFSKDWDRIEKGTELIRVEGTFTYDRGFQRGAPNDFCFIVTAQTQSLQEGKFIRVMTAPSCTSIDMTHEAREFIKP